MARENSVWCDESKLSRLIDLLTSCNDDERLEVESQLLSCMSRLINATVSAALDDLRNAGVITADAAASYYDDAVQELSLRLIHVIRKFDPQMLKEADAVSGFKNYVLQACVWWRDRYVSKLKNSESPWVEESAFDGGDEDESFEDVFTFVGMKHVRKGRTGVSAGSSWSYAPLGFSEAEQVEEEIKRHLNDVMGKLSVFDEAVLRFRLGAVTGTELDYETLGALFGASKEAARLWAKAATGKLAYLVDPVLAEGVMGSFKELGEASKVEEHEGDAVEG